MLHRKDIIALMYITILTIAALVYGFNIIPSPHTEQLMVADHKRVIDLGSIQTTIDDYYQNNSVLPQSLNDLNYNANDSSTPLNKFDPQTRQPYVYFATSPTTYQLCATFSTDSSHDDANAYDDQNNDYVSFSDQFKHPVGHYCFDESEAADDSPSPYDMPSTSPSPSPYDMHGNTPTPAPLNGQNSGGGGL